MSDEGIKSVDRDEFRHVFQTQSFELLKHDTRENYVLSLSEKRPHERTDYAYEFPPRLLEELARHILRTVAPTTEDRMLSALNRIEQLLRQREQ